MIPENPTYIIGLASLCILLILIGYTIGRSTFKGERGNIFVIVLILGEISFFFHALTNPWILIMIGSMTGFLLIVVIFGSSIFLGAATLFLGVPSIILFLYSFLNQNLSFWFYFINAGIFLIGLIVSLIEFHKPLEDMTGKLFPIFLFSFSIIGVFLIPNIFPQFETIAQIAEIIGIILGIFLKISLLRG